ncbi:T9SS type A sorting domain-containing protein [Flavobacterium caeni]|uniref:Por secretion system C-terminal sorting domain-containing protein n=1 Tax=Flavobacterium caeni TaxID=490189 RepID=A0A1G5HV53_9FLAO|nr:T9SS type A sorting domain-containing protein [Flavobacterium caeni]SCY66918.1 Por secretion system C-terminal sorting domain-containing protein [Flavobacterium caeni]
MKKPLLLLVFLVSMLCNAQSWQWGKRGGGDQAISDLNWIETVRTIKVDSQGNVYAICPVSTANLDVDGHPKIGYGNGGTIDHALVSFACDGTYRWSKIIGGQYNDSFNGLQIDSEGNVFVSGRVIVTSTGSPPVHFDEDLVLEQSASNVNTFKRGLYIIKYDTNGQMQWIRMPQPEDISLAGNLQCQSLGLSTDQDGNSYWFTRLYPGSYADGAYLVSGSASSYHVLKYNGQGNFEDGVQISLAPSGPSETVTKMAVNHDQGTIYFAGYIITQAGWGMNFNGEPVNNDMYLVAYDSNGNFLWKKESSQNMNRGTGFTDIHINEAGDIYLSGGTGNGMAFGTYTFNSTNNSNFPFVIKTNANGDVIWGSNSSTTAGTYAAAISEGAATGGFAGNFNWGGHSLSVPDNTGYDVFMTRFNPATGEIIALETLADDDGYADFGTAVTKDLHGNFYVGGSFEHFLYVNSATPMINDGPQTDFFIAKFGSSNCELAVEQYDKTHGSVYPNPASGILNVTASENATYAVYSLLGQIQSSGTVGKNGQIDIAPLAGGVYILKITMGDQVETFKFVKQ